MCLVRIAVLTAPLLAVVACQSSTANGPGPLNGRVVKKEYRAPDVEMEVSEVARERYVIDDEGNRDTVVVEVTETAPSTKSPECYRLAVRRSDGDIVDICNKKAYKALDVDDEFSEEKYGKQDGKVGK